MEILFTNQFEKDIRKIKDKALAVNIEKVILSSKSAKKISEIANIKKLKGSQNAYRIRIGSYRIGIYVTDNTLEFVCFMSRKDIYKYFP